MKKLPVSMQALQLQGIDHLERVEMPVPVPKADEVLVRVRQATICTSDLHDIQSNPFGIRYPRVMGHEGAGEVVARGSAVVNIQIGAYVAMHPVVHCGECSECQRGLAHLCARMGHLGIDRDGCFAQYLAQRADRVFPLTDTSAIAIGSLLEPVAVCLEAIARAGTIAGRQVLVVGDGPFGNIIARLANRAGAARVVVSGRDPWRMAQIRDAETVTGVPEKAFDIAILAVSAADAVATCMRALRPRGRLVVFSTVSAPVPIDLFTLHVSELDVVGACNDEDMVEEALACLADPQLRLAELITHHIPFNDWREAFALARQGDGSALKIALTFL